jgi:hypothetical protein
MLRTAGILSHRPAKIKCYDCLNLPPSRWERLDRALAGVRGEGQSGVRRGYLWMLIGHDDLVKPDRVVLRWLQILNGQVGRCVLGVSA